MKEAKMIFTIINKSMMDKIKRLYMLAASTIKNWIKIIRMICLMTIQIQIFDFPNSYCIFLDIDNNNLMDVFFVINNNLFF